MIYVNEIYKSIQGEGFLNGRPSVFLRLGGCNLRCPGFNIRYTVNGKTYHGCDSYYAVDPSFKKTWSKYEKFNEIVKEIDQYFDKFNVLEPVTDLVITGGEPLIYWNNSEFQKLLVYYVSRGIQVTIETNASINIDNFKEYHKNIIFSMSVKLSNSGEPESKRLNFDTINKILEHSPKSYFKFVIKDKSDVDEIYDILENIPYYAPVYVMPLGCTKSELSVRNEIVAKIAVENNFIFSPRTHIEIWDSKRKV